MKKLIFTLAIVTLSGSSIVVGMQRYQTGTKPASMVTKPITTPLRQQQKAGVTRYDDPRLQERQAQTAGVSAYDDPNLQDCLNAKGRSQQTLQECRDLVYGDAGKGVTHY